MKLSILSVQSFKYFRAQNFSNINFQIFSSLIFLLKKKLLKIFGVRSRVNKNIFKIYVKIINFFIYQNWEKFVYQTSEIRSGWFLNFRIVKIDHHGKKTLTSFHSQNTKKFDRLEKLSKFLHHFFHSICEIHKKPLILAQHLFNLLLVSGQRHNSKSCLSNQLFARTPNCSSNWPYKLNNFLLLGKECKKMR